MVVFTNTNETEMQSTHEISSDENLDPSISRVLNQNVDEFAEIPKTEPPSDDENSNKGNTKKQRTKAEYIQERNELEKKKNEIIRNTLEDLKPDNSLKTWFSYDIDIENQIRIEKQSLVKKGLLLCIVTICGLLTNTIGLSLVAALSKNVVLTPMNNVIFSVFALALGIAGAIFMFKCLYYSNKTKVQNQRFLQLGFWVVFAVHVGYVIYSIVGLPSWATSGVFNLVTQLGPGGSWVVVCVDLLNILVWSFAGFLTFLVGREYKRNSIPAAMANGHFNTGLFNSISLDV